MKFIELTQASGREFWVEVKCVCAVEDRGTRRRVRMLDQTTMDVTETAQDIVDALEAA